MRKSMKSLGALLLAGSMFFVMPPALAQEPPVLDSGEVAAEFYADFMPFGTPDYQPPELISVTLDKTEVEAPGVITVTIEVTDDISGADEIYLSFKSVETKISYNRSFGEKKALVSSLRLLKFHSTQNRVFIP